MTRRELLQSCGAALVPQASRSAARRPNIVLILSDDQGYGDLSCHGNPHLKTPHMDRLGKEGVEFTRFYVSPVCAPTRSSLLTGRYNLRCGVHGVTRGFETMRPEETTLAEALRPAGYRTALFGKWHLGEHYPYVPHAQGFDEFIGFRTGHWIDYYDSHLERNGKPYDVKGFITDVLTGEAVRFIDANRENPFCLYMAYNLPHAPHEVPQPYFERYRGLPIPEVDAAIYGMVSKLDENIGRLLAHLESRKLANDTIVIFLSDNGPNGRRFNCGLRGIKGSVYEGGIRVPFFVRWPGNLPAGRRVDTMAAHIDLYPTLLAMCGVEPPKGLPVDGRNILPLMKGDEGKWPDRMFFTIQTRDTPAIGNPGAVRTDRYCLVNRKELYDLAADRNQTTDISAQHPEQVRQLGAAYEDWFRAVTAGQSFERYPIPAGYAEENPVVLSAPQAYMTGGLRYWGKAGWAHDWITGWTGIDGSVYWDIDVVNAGRYEVTLHYLCPAADVGSKVLVTAAGASAEATIEQATSMDPLPNRDLIPRTEAPEMRWGALRLPVLTLERGRTRLTVRALSKAGTAVMDLKDATLRRQ